MKRTLSFVILFLFATNIAIAQEAVRKGWMGANGSFSERGMALDTAIPGSTIHTMGLRKGDTIVVLNGTMIVDVSAYNRVASEIRTGDKVVVKFKRGSNTREKRSIAVMKPFDTLPNGEVVYGWAQMGNCKLRTIVRKPKRSQSMPAILFIPGYNCGSVEGYGQGSYGKLINTWISNGFAVVTIEKTGLGDSYGCVSCMDADLATDIQVFETGYQFMERLPYADKNNLFIFGHSMGGVIAPIIAEKHSPRGVIAFATVYRPWSEFLLEMHRVQWPLDGKSYAETEDRTRLIQKVYYEYFRLKKSPAELYENPEYKDLVASELEYTPGAQHMWGRHWRFWQQLDSVDLARSWSNVNAKVLSVFGGADFVACSELEHELIVRAVNSTHPGNAEHLNIADVDHLMIRNPDWPSAHKHFMDAAYKKDNFHQGFADKLTGWMKGVMQ
ncbi:serine aminopeptidase domain-containing protein [Polluticoccus soli]|uniref:serine aminopeptidase domain-containing protein n=1 Tax=Polluticoccus soli TaxID=3034150 RepID=UPI0023E1A916|nr:alpha/beta hydrolase [Flavipsychrobacter sp. JY13-12]